MSARLRSVCRADVCCRKEGFAGATALRGIEGFGARSLTHTVNILDLSGDVPIVIEVVDSQEHIDRLVRILDEMMSGGLVTLEKVQVLRYSAQRQTTSGGG